MKFMVSYDLKWNKNYNKLYSVLDELKATKIHASLWGVVSGLSIDQISAVVKNATDWDDEIMVFPAPTGYQVREKNLNQQARSFLNVKYGGGLGGLYI